MPTSCPVLLLYLYDIFNSYIPCLESIPSWLYMNIYLSNVVSLSMSKVSPNAQFYFLPDRDIKFTFSTHNFIF
jgi:hypothetical protein